MQASRTRFLAGIVMAACLAARAKAQAWLPPKGEASLSLGYGSLFVTKHFLGTFDNPGDNVQTDRGHIRGQSVGIELGYGLTDRLALSVGIPFVRTKYYGSQPHITDLDTGSTLDDGRYHGTFQDYRIAIRYLVWNSETIAVAPFASAVIPSHSYAYFAHSAAGRDLHEYSLGASFGGRLDRILAGSYVQAVYSYAFVERIAGIHHDRSDVAVEAGYALTPSLVVRAIGTGFYTHGGLIFKSGRSIPPDLFPHHDQIDKSSAINLGGGLSYVLTGSTEVYMTYLRTMQGRGGHKIDYALSFGVGWSFSPQQLVRRYFPARSIGAGGAL